jgi:hypothetical protein|nr:MAG TPA: hypothetical protein [Caudoviricetes sp.]
MNNINLTKHPVRLWYLTQAFSGDLANISFSSLKLKSKLSLYDTLYHFTWFLIFLKYFAFIIPPFL